MMGDGDGNEYNNDNENSRFSVEALCYLGKIDVLLSSRSPFVTSDEIIGWLM